MAICYLSILRIPSNVDPIKCKLIFVVSRKAAIHHRTSHIDSLPVRIVYFFLLNIVALYESWTIARMYTCIFLQSILRWIYHWSSSLNSNSANVNFFFPHINRIDACEEIEIIILLENIHSLFLFFSCFSFLFGLFHRIFFLLYVTHTIIIIFLSWGSGCHLLSTLFSLVFCL